MFLHPTECERAYTISEINEGVATLIESGQNVLWIEGELSEAKQASSGHWYMRLTDSICQIPAVMWRTVADKNTITPKNGLLVSVIASLKVYRKGGYYQLEVHKLQLQGKGSKSAALEKLKQKLRDEGLFDPLQKKPIPTSVTTLGVITSITGAALQDILKIVSQRSPSTQVLLCHVSVQGLSAPKEIISALHDMNTYKKADCIILGRGGGSKEDLDAFNQEAVVRAIAASTIPIISAIGHEIDTTLSDYAADLRAPTPTAAAEMVLTDTEILSRSLDEYRRLFASQYNFYFSSCIHHYSSLKNHSALKRVATLLSETQQSLDMTKESFLRSILLMVERLNMAVEKKRAELHSLNPTAILQRGYCIATAHTGLPITDSSLLKRDDTISLRFLKGSATAVISETEHLSMNGYAT